MPEFTSECVDYEVIDAAAVVTLDRQSKRNALTPDMQADVADAFRTADDDEEIRSIILTGAGEDSFCAGADLDQMIGEATGDNPDVEPGPNDLAFRHELIGTPIIAAVNGDCVGGGMEVLQATDIRIATESAQFGLPEAKQGLAPVGGSMVRLPRQIPHCEAMLFLLTGKLFPASHAKEAGLLNEVVSETPVLERALEYAELFHDTSPHSVRRIKETVSRTQGRPLEDAFRLETQIANEIFSHPDSREGPEAFLESRSPDYRR